MAKLAKLLQAAAGAGTAGGLNVEEVFSTYLYTGNATAGTNITTGIDLSTEGGLLWTKKRSAAADHYLFDTETAAISGAFSKRLKSNATDPLGTEMNALTSFNTDGFTISTNGAVNGSGSDYASWTFRKAPKFFDVVTYTGTGSAQTISHNLGSVPGVMIVKATSTTENWAVYHRSLGATKALRLNLTNAQSGSDAYWNNTEPTSTQFTVGNGGHTGANGVSYVAYLFAHNNSDGDFGPTGDQDIIKCGSYTGTGSNGNFVNLGFEPQWIMVKRTNSTGNWIIVDNMRSLSHSDYAWLYPNTSDAESAGASSTGLPSAEATGFTLNSSSIWMNASGSTYIYVAIRRGPMAVPTAGTDVFAIDTFGSTGDGKEPAFRSTFPVDMQIYKSTTGTSSVNNARLTQGKYLSIDTNDFENTGSWAQFDYQNGFYGGNTTTISHYYSWMWKRAPNYFDVVAYTGNGTAGRTVSHNLGVAPEMMWVKRRDSADNWLVYHSGLDVDGDGRPETDALVLDTSGAAFDYNRWNDTAPTATNFTVHSDGVVNASGGDYIAYLFASLDGVSKVGSYTGSNSVQTIDCGFSSGARFVLIKNIGAAADWFVYDSERGIVAGNDPFLRINDTTAQNTATDYIDPDNSGFIVNGNIEAINQSGYTYIFYAIA